MQKEEHNHYENWSDFEMGMARYAKNFTDENKDREPTKDEVDELIAGTERIIKTIFLVMP